MFNIILILSYNVVELFFEFFLKKCRKSLTSLVFGPKIVEFVYDVAYKGVFMRLYVGGYLDWVTLTERKIEDAENPIKQHVIKINLYEGVLHRINNI